MPVPIRRRPTIPPRWTRTSLRRGVAEFVGTFTLIFIGGGAGIVSGQRHRRRRARERPRDRDHGLEPRPHLGRPLQPGDHARLPRDAPDHAARSRSPTGSRSSRGAIVAAAILPLALPRSRAVRSAPSRTRRRHRRRQGLRRRDHPDVLPRLGRLRDRGRPARRVQVDRRPRDRAHDHDRRPHGRPAHRRGDEPGARVRPGARSATSGATAGSTTSARRSARSIAAVAYEYLYLRPLRPSVVGTPESGVAEPRPGDTALD